MKRALAAVLITVFLITCALIVTARVPDSEVERRDAKTITVVPLTERSGKNVALVLEVRPDKQKTLPGGLTILVNGKQVHMYDDGRWPDEHAGDGLYTAAGRTNDGRPLREKFTSPIREDSASFLPTGATPSIGCTFNVVDCGANCKSIIFGSKCVVCFKLSSCEFSF